MLKPYYPSLDGLRAVAILLVFWVHFGGTTWDWQIFQWGWVGVDLFFVLSGFLITGILYDTMQRPDYFSNFYIRRSLRIFPLYYAMWAAFLLFGFVPGIHMDWNRYDWTLVAYIGNFFIPGGKAGHYPDLNLLYLKHHGVHGHIVIGQLWSLCVEEQFYLIWPAVVLWIKQRGRLMWLCGCTIVVEPFLRLLYLHRYPSMLHVEGVYANTFFRVDTLLFGAFVALWLRGTTPFLVSVRKTAIATCFLCTITLVLLIHFEKNRPFYASEDPIVNTFGFTLVAAASTGMLLLAIDPETFVARVLKHPALLWTGRISYGLYIIHGPVTGLIASEVPSFKSHHIQFLLPVLATCLTLCLAWLSFRFIESPFLRLKSRWALRPGAIDDPPPYPLH